MSKRDIISAAKKKGVTFKTVQWDSPYPTPGGCCGCWWIELSDESEEAIAAADPSFRDWNPDLYNSERVMSWIESMPAIAAQTARGGK